VNSAGGDGRTKPDLAAPGTHVQAGVPQSSYNGTTLCNQYYPAGQTLYSWSSGTSHAAPAVAGGCALVRQWFLNDGLAAPSPAMVKAVLVAAADHMTGVGANDALPSNNQGFGRMDLARAFDGSARTLLDQTTLLAASGESYLTSGVVADLAQPLRVTLAWTDAPGSTIGAPFVNDLDLTVAIGATTYKGNVFTGASSTPGGSADLRNNVESVFLPAGTAGTVVVRVEARALGGDGVPGNGDPTDQDFALVLYNVADDSAPVAEFAATPLWGRAPLAVAFTDLSLGDVTGWSWDFGDGTASSARHPTHVYHAAGVYTVTLDASGPSGVDQEKKLRYVRVLGPRRR
jgi:hypothetical protein